MWWTSKPTGHDHTDDNASRPGRGFADGSANTYGRECGRATLKRKRRRTRKVTSRDGREPCNAASPTAITAAEHRSILDSAFALWIAGLPATSRRTGAGPYSGRKQDARTELDHGARGLPTWKLLTSKEPSAVADAPTSLARPAAME